MSRKQTSERFSLCFDGSTENLMAIAHVMAQEDYLILTITIKF
ncbi:hypothetical protein [Gloeocapsopsis crepidinum]|nr:hypothetical protein [Gloeocapsopsis crepidinum]